MDEAAMRKMIQFLIGAVLLSSASAFAQQEVQPGLKTADGVLVCATAADAKNYAALHKNAIRSAIEGEVDAKACLIAKIAFLPGKQTERIEDKDTTYVLTEILIVAVKTPYGMLKMRPNLAYTLMPVDEEKA
jgi:hypothetical protein